MEQLLILFALGVPSMLWTAGCVLLGRWLRGRADTTSPWPEHMRRLAPLVLLAVLAVGCATDESTTTAPATTTTTTVRPAPTTDPVRPRWCSFYDDWRQAGDTMASIERTHGSKVTTWPSDAYTRWERALAAQSRAAGVLWDGTEAGTVPRGWDARARAWR